MPGETPETVQETADFCKYALTLSPTQNPNDLSINYAQALPGTPMYEYARHKGLIGQDLDGEEEYLLKIRLIPLAPGAHDVACLPTAGRPG